MKTYIIIGALLSALGMALRAFGSHSLKTKLNPEELVIYDIATIYLMYHALGIISLGIWAFNVPESVVEVPVILLLRGIVLFSGSLCLISIKGYTKLGVITPLGGTAFIVSWVLLAINIFKLP